MQQEDPPQKPKADSEVVRPKEPHSHKKQTGRWSKEEHDRFVMGIVQHGKDWKKVEQVVITRTGSQVRSHAQKFFNKLSKKDSTPQERQSDTENEGGNFNQDSSFNTPQQLVSLIRKESDRGELNLAKLKSSLEAPPSMEPGTDPMAVLQRHHSFRSLSNVISAFETANDDEPVAYANESFLLHLTRKYKRLFQKGDLSELIDFSPSPPKQPETTYPVRKSSFTLVNSKDNSKGQQLKRRNQASLVEPIAELELARECSFQQLDQKVEAQGPLEPNPAKSNNSSLKTAVNQTGVKELQISVISKQGSSLTPKNIMPRQNSQPIDSNIPNKPQLSKQYVEKKKDSYTQILKQQDQKTKKHESQ